MSTASWAPRYKVIAASAGAFAAAALTLYTDIFGADVAGDADKFVKAFVIAAGAFASGWVKRDGVPGANASGVPGEGV